MLVALGLEIPQTLAALERPGSSMERGLPASPKCWRSAAGQSSRTLSKKMQVSGFLP